MNEYELPKTNAVKFLHEGKPSVRLSQIEWDNVIDHLLALQSILIGRKYREEYLEIAQEERPETVQPTADSLSLIRAEIMPKLTEWYMKWYMKPHEVGEGDSPDPPSIVYEALQKAHDLGAAMQAENGEENNE